MSGCKRQAAVTTRLILIVGLSMIYSTVCSQTWDEWFKQRRTQRRYLLTQIAELRVYADFLQKGYTIANEGLRLVSDIKKGEFDLHNRFFTSLKNINPEVLRFAQVGEIVALQTSIYKRYKKGWAQINAAELFTNSELTLFRQTFSALIHEVTATVDDLIAVTTANKLEMTDDERIKRIDRLRAQVNEQSVSLNQIQQDIFSVARARIIEQGEISLLQGLYGE